MCLIMHLSRGSGTKCQVCPFTDGLVAPAALVPEEGRLTKHPMDDVKADESSLGMAERFWDGCQDLEAE